MIQDSATAGVAVPMLNAEQTIGAALTSIRRQTCQALDIVAVDDGSVGGSASIVTACAEKINASGYVSGRLFYLRTRRG